MADEQENEAQPTASTKKKRAPIIPIVIFVVLAFGGGIGAAWFLSRKAPAQASEKPKAEVDKPKAGQEVKAVVHLESFVVNLADPGQSAFLRVGIDLGLEKELPAGKEADKASPLNPRIRDAMLGVLTTWRSDALLAPDGKDKLKEGLLRTLHERVPELGVTEVYFTDFLVQR